MLVKWTGVLASLALFGVAAAAKGWKFVLVPARGGQPIEFKSCLIDFDAEENADMLAPELEPLNFDKFAEAASGNEDMKFLAWFFTFMSTAENASMPVRMLKRLKHNTFAWEGELDIEEKHQKFKSLLLFKEGEELFPSTGCVYRDQLNLLEASEDEDGYKVVKVEYPSNDHQATPKGRTPPSQNFTGWCGTCD